MVPALQGSFYILDVFYLFSSYSQWEAGVQCLSVLDVLISLAHFSRSGDAICRPEFVLPDDDNKVSITLTVPEYVYVCYKDQRVIHIEKDYY